MVNKRAQDEVTRLNQALMQSRSPAMRRRLLVLRDRARDTVREEERAEIERARAR